MSSGHVSRTFKIVYCFVVWMWLFSFVHPAYGAWDTLKAEVTFTAQTGVWTPAPTPAPTPTPPVPKEAPAVLL
ncbi:MAG: hypothetical protein RR581_07760, partial [Eubacterium sp.]